MQTGRVTQGKHPLETHQQPQEVVVRLPSRQHDGLEPVGELGIRLYGPEGVPGADADDAYLQFVAQILLDVQKGPLPVEVAREDVVYLVDDQHLELHVAQQLHHMELLLVHPFARPVGGEEQLQYGVVEAPLVGHRRSLDQDHRRQNVVTGGVVPGRMGLYETPCQHGLAVVGVADQQQVGHAVGAGMGNQLLQSGQNGLGPRIADPTF